MTVIIGVLYRYSLDLYIFGSDYFVFLSSGPSTDGMIIIIVIIIIVFVIFSL